MMGKCVMALAWAAIFLLAGTPSRAQWHYNFSLGVGVELNDNVDLATEGELETVEGEGAAGPGPEEAAEDPSGDGPAEQVPPDDVVTIVRPAARVTWSKGEDSLLLDYVGTYRAYGEESRKTQWFHAGQAELTWRRLDPLHLAISDRIDYIPPDLTRPDEDPRNQVQRNVLVLRPSLVWKPERTLSFELSYEARIQTYREEASGGSEGEVAETIDEHDDTTRHLGLVTLEKRWSPGWRTGLQAGGGRTERSLSANYDFTLAGFTILHRFSARDEVEYGFNWERRFLGNPVTDEQGSEAAAEPAVEPQGDEDHVLHTIMFRRRLQHGELQVSYKDTVEDRFDGDTLDLGRAEGIGQWRFRGGSMLSGVIHYEKRDFTQVGRDANEWGPAVNVSWKLSDWATLSLSGSLAWTLIKEGMFDPGDRDLRVDVDETRTQLKSVLSFTYGRHLSLETGYQYLENDSTNPANSYTNNRVWAMITAGFAGSRLADLIP